MSSPNTDKDDVPNVGKAGVIFIILMFLALVPLGFVVWKASGSTGPVRVTLPATARSNISFAI
jgi:hypothetical protein